MKKLICALAFATTLTPFSLAYASNSASVLVDWSQVITIGDSVTFSSYGGGNGGVSGYLGDTNYYSNTSNPYGSVSLQMFSSGATAVVNTPEAGSPMSVAGVMGQVYRTFSLTDSQSVLIKLPFTVRLTVEDDRSGSDAAGADVDLYVWDAPLSRFSAYTSEIFDQRTVGILNKSGYLNLYIGNDSGTTKNYVLVAGGGARVGAIAPVPEPETYALLLAGLGLVGAAVKRRKAKQA